jgi:hypothetical protein
MLVVNVLAVRVPVFAWLVGVRVGVGRPRGKALVVVVVVVPVVMAMRVVMAGGDGVHARLVARRAVRPKCRAAGCVARYNAALTYTFGLDTSPHRTQRRFIGADPSGGPGGSW